jgi:hypothetical protein
MDESPVTATPVERKKGHRFQKGHPPFKRKPKDRTLRSAIETCAKMGFDPIKIMVEIVQTGVLTEPGPGGKKIEVAMPTRLKLLREICAYVHPKAPVTVAGKIEHEHTHASMVAIMTDPALAAAAEMLAFAQLEGPDLDQKCIAADLESAAR